MATAKHKPRSTPAPPEVLTAGEEFFNNVLPKAVVKFVALAAGARKAWARGDFFAARHTPAKFRELVDSVLAYRTPATTASQEKKIYDVVYQALKKAVPKTRRNYEEKRLAHFKSLLPRWQEDLASQVSGLLYPGIPRMTRERAKATADELALLACAAVRRGLTFKHPRHTPDDGLSSRQKRQLGRLSAAARYGGGGAKAYARELVATCISKSHEISNSQPEATGAGGKEPIRVTRVALDDETLVGSAAFTEPVDAELLLVSTLAELELVFGVNRVKKAAKQYLLFLEARTTGDKTGWR